MSNLTPKLKLTMIHTGGEEKEVDVLGVETRGKKLLLRWSTLAGVYVLDVTKNKVIGAPSWKAKLDYQARSIWKELRFQPIQY